MLSITITSDILLLALLVTFPVIGVLAVLGVGVLVLQKLRLQTSLEDSRWWLIDYGDITIVREASVRDFGGCCTLRRVVFVEGLIGGGGGAVSIQGKPSVSLSTSRTLSGSGGSHSTLSHNSCGFKDKMGKEQIYATVGLYQVLTMFIGNKKSPTVVVAFVTARRGITWPSSTSRRRFARNSSGPPSSPNSTW